MDGFYREALTTSMLIIGFAGGFAVGFILAKLRSWHELEEYEVGYWYTIHSQDDRIDALEEEKQVLRDRLAAEIWHSRRLTRTQDDRIDTLMGERQGLHDHLAIDLSRTRHGRSTSDDEAQWRTDEIERQITAWEKL